MTHPGLEYVQKAICAAAIASGRDPKNITLIAVSKTFGAAEILPVIAAGQRDFGENRVQESKTKWPALKAGHPGLKLHLIGHLQSNKAAEAVTLFDAIHTVDRTRIAEALAAEMKRQRKFPQLFIQVNTGREAQKAGVLPENAADFIRDCKERLDLAIAGLMCIPPVNEDPQSHFELLATIARQYGIVELSMGMSGDFATAIKCGATYVRVGSAIFGSRS